MPATRARWRFARVAEDCLLIVRGVDPPAQFRCLALNCAKKPKSAVGVIAGLTPDRLTGISIADPL